MNITIADIAGVVSALAVCISLIMVAASNRKLSQSMKLANMQAMISEMNTLRRLRADEPDLERSLFPDREAWTDTEIQHNLTAVQLANVFEWAYFARRDGLIEKDVWDSWVETWRSVILASEPLRQAFQSSVWTFGRSDAVSSELNKLISLSGPISDPHRKN